MKLHITQMSSSQPKLRFSPLPREEFMDLGAKVRRIPDWLMWFTAFHYWYMDSQAWQINTVYKRLITSHRNEIEMKRLLLLGFFALALHLPCAAQTANSGTATPAAEQQKAAQAANLPETGSALPLISTIGAGVLLGGLVSARRTRPQK